MPRNYKKTMEKAKWSAGDLKNAIDAIEGGSTLRPASKVYNILVTTLFKRLKARNFSGPQLGHKPVIPPSDEEQFVEKVLHMSRLFYGVSQGDLK